MTSAQRFLWRLELIATYPLFRLRGYRFVGAVSCKELSFRELWRAGR